MYDKYVLYVRIISLRFVWKEVLKDNTYVEIFPFTFRD